MKRPFLQSTLRELHLVVKAPRLWATFAAVVLIFWVTGPYGTAERLAAVPRLGFWLVLHAATWAIAIVSAVLANVLLRERVASGFVRMMIGAAVASIPIGLVTTAIGSATFSVIPTAADIMADIATGLFLSLLFCALTWMTMNTETALELNDAGTAAMVPGEGESRTSGDPVPQKDTGRVPLLLRLKPANRGLPLHLTVSDHYTEVTTTVGRELILLRFADALGELGPVPGLQVHRSHWVSDAHFERLVRDNGRIVIVLRDGTEVPVSRTYAAAVRQRWG
ncbi:MULTISPECIES: LytTR family DNA-binding domain-containing protein [unclassified Ensifer]|uniref:LytTR family DNA-binding domain-containing protein n=1 Tax=unclassified Ensifer TaxID=2633371 RepID=UPI001146ABEC|nr:MULTISPECIES: LytTR family DNA-binding domain-containing protein [unclassified Ensifer]